MVRVSISGACRSLAQVAIFSHGLRFPAGWVVMLLHFRGGSQVLTFSAWWPKEGVEWGGRRTVTRRET